MGSYYYLMAQLPALLYEQKPPMTSASFKELARSLLSEEDSFFLKYLSVAPAAASRYPSSEEYAACGCLFIDEWRQWERAFTLNLAKHRAAKLHRDNTPVSEPPSYPHDAALSAAAAAAGDVSPLEAEIRLDKVRWNVIDLLAGIDYFGRDTVYAYYLKLLLLERRQSFNTEIGFSEYKSLYADIIESAHKSLGEPK